MKSYDAEAVRGQGIIGKLVSDVRKEGANEVLRRGIVREYISSQSFLDELLVQALVNEGVDRGALLKCPPNSLVVIPTDRGQSHEMNRLVVCYPFFSHVLSPVKPGEMIWFTDASTGPPDPAATYWWLGRVVLPDQSEDNNYAHHDRQYWDSRETGYPNGADGNSSFTLPGSMNAFDALVEVSVSAQEFAPTASPRPVGSPNHTGLYGSHRNGVRFDVEGGRGFSDLFAGSARPRARRTSRGWEEYDHSQADNDQAGSYQRIADAQSRVFLCEDARGIEESMGVRDVQPDPSTESYPIPFSNGGAAVLYARNGVHVAGEGFVRIDGGDGATVLVQQDQVLLKSNTCRVDSNDIVLGGSDAVIRLCGAESSEPAVLGEQLRDWHAELLAIVDSLVTNLQGSSIPMPTGPPVPLASALGPEGTLGATLAALSARLSVLGDAQDRYLSTTVLMNPASRAE